VPALTTMSQMSGHASASICACAIVATGSSLLVPLLRSLPPLGGVATKIRFSAPEQAGSGTSSRQPEPVVVSPVLVLSAPLDELSTPVVVRPVVVTPVELSGPVVSGSLVEVGAFVVLSLSPTELPVVVLPVVGVSGPVVPVPVARRGSFRTPSRRW
jgi:hypothetical protein